MNRIQRPKQKPNYERIQSYATTFSLIFIPLIVAAISAFVAYKQNNNQNATEYIKIGVGILTAKPDENSKQTREWAIELINNYAPVKMSAEAKKELINTSELPKTVLDKLMDSSNNDSTHHLQWDGHSSGQYSIETQIYRNGEWKPYSGISVTGTSIDIPLPKSEKIRWKVTDVSSKSTEYNQQSEWKLVDD
jgi:hypothetical protein